MLWPLAMLLLMLWIVGVLTSYTMGGFVHVLLVLSVAAIVLRVRTGGRTL